MLVKEPPAKILPSACTAIEETAPSRVRVERISQPGRGIEPGDAVARLSADARRNRRPPESCRPPAPRLNRHRLFAFGLNESAKPVVAIEPGDVVARLSADACEIAAH